MIEIYFIRHGQASFGAPDYDHLSPLGKMQSGFLGNYLLQSGIQFDAVYTGSLKRQVETAAIALNGQAGKNDPDVRIDPGFNEFDGSDQMMGRLHGVMENDPALQATLRTIHTDRHAIGRIFKLVEEKGLSPNNEAERDRQMKAFRTKVAGAINTVVNDVGQMKKVAVFTSGGPITVALRLALKTSKEETVRLSRAIRNTSVTVLRYENRQPSLVLFNSVAHLEIQRDPHLITYI